MSSTIPIADVIAGLKIVGSYDFKGAIAAFKAKDQASEADVVLMTAEDIAKILGLFFPGAATAAEWIEVVRFLLPYAIKLSERYPPHVLGPNEYEAWGHSFKK